MRFLWIYAIACMLAATTPALAQIGMADVTGGKVSGVVVGEIASFKGIPFAAPPVGDLRWKSPQPVISWQGVKKADNFGATCMQDAGAAVSMGSKSKVSEDCLYLNVWTPAKTEGEKLPVMVWIYGGGFSMGMTSSPLYDGTNFAKKGVVLVSIAYRVGPLGFLAHPELSKESGHGSGTYGLMDQIAGLKWVKENIAKFGGDPANVTIFGESAGGISVSMLTASPPAKGLFHKAISESGGSMAGPRYSNEGGTNVPPLKVAEANGGNFFKKLGVANLKAARGLSAEQIQNGVRGAPMGIMFWPVFDGYVLPGDQYELFEQGKFNDVSVLIGTNADEGAMFRRPGVTPASFEQQIHDGYGVYADKILAVYPHANEAQAVKSSQDIFRDTGFAWHSWAWAKLQTQMGKGKAFVYYLEHKTPQSPDGASHGTEMVYVFGNMEKPTADDLALSDQMMRYWVNFAKKGDPNGADLPAWPVYSLTGERVLRLAPTGAYPYPNMTQIKVLNEYYAWRRVEAKKKAQLWNAPQK